MNVSVEKLPKSMVQLRVDLSEDEVKPYLSRAVKELSETKTPKGFRPGNVPFEVMRSAVGDEAIVERALRELVPRTYLEALREQEDLEAIGQPDIKVESASLGAPWVYRATVAVLPDVQLPGDRHVQSTRRSVTVEEREIARELETLRKMRASYLTVPRAAQMGDRVEVDITARADGAPLEGGAEKRQAFLLGEGGLLPGFEEQLVGLKENASKTFSLPMPDRHHQADLRGRTIDFSITVRTVQQRILPELTDAFAQGLGRLSTLQELRAQLTSNLHAEKEAREHERFRLELLEQVMARTTFGEFSEVLIGRELDAMVAELEGEVTNMGLPFSQYLAQVKRTREELRADLRPQALRRIRAGLTLRALGEREKVEVTEGETAEEINTILKAFANPEEAQRRLDLDSLREMATAAVRNRKIFALLERWAAGG